MPARQITPQSEVDNYLRGSLMSRKGRIIAALNYVGLACVTEARTGHKYMDRSGNLTSSMGYVVIDNGKVANQGGFDQVLNGSEGKKSGEQFINKLVQENSKGIVLIIVAGMNYAAYVEAKNYNVLSSSELLARRIVPYFMKRLGFTTR